jgi:HemK-related putative methylase
MMQVSHFIKKTELRQCRVQGLEIPLVVNEKIFPPSPHGLFFAEKIKINSGETVIDVGTGSGLLAIMSAKLGAGKVWATDVSRSAIKVALANSLLNDVNIKFIHGSYFGESSNKFDVIIANLPQELVHNTYLKNIGNLAGSIDGGKGGNQILIDFLRIAPNFMNERSRLYLPVVTLTNYEETIRNLLHYYNVQLVAFVPSETKEFVSEFIDDYRPLQKRGIINIFKRENKWMIYEFIFLLTKKM